MSAKAHADRAEQDMKAALDPLPGLPELDSHAVDVASCPGDRTQQTRTCRPLMGYTVIETRSELSDFRMVVSSRTQMQVFLEPENCPRAVHAAKLEYRLYEGRPFAVIQQVDCLPTPTGRARTDRKPLSRVFVVRGLAGFEGLHHVVAIQRRKSDRALGKARHAADQHLLAAWPRLRAEIEAERQRAVDAAAKVKDTEDRTSPDDAEPATPDNVEITPDGKLVVFIDVSHTRAP